MKNIILLVLCTVFILSGCANKYTLYSTRTKQISKENKSLETQYTETSSILKLKRDKFTNEEWRSLINTSSTINMLISKYKAICKLKFTEISVSEIEFLWQLATEGFYQARSVVEAKYSLLTPSAKVMVDSFDKRVQETDTELANLLSYPSEENINNALVLVSGTLNYSARMVSTMAIQL